MTACVFPKLQASFLMAQWSRRLATISYPLLGWNQKIPGSTPGGEAYFFYCEYYALTK